MEQITTNGPSYRTKCLSLEAASRFAKCVAANSTRFVVTGIEESAKAKSECRYYVRFCPVNPERLGEIIDRQQARRDERAAAEGDGYLWDHAPNGKWSWCSSLSGETYTVSDCDCDCPDYVYRCRHAAMACKHILARRALLEGDPAEEYRYYVDGEELDRIDHLREAAEEADRRCRAEWGSANVSKEVWR